MNSMAKGCVRGTRGACSLRVLPCELPGLVSGPAALAARPGLRSDWSGLDWAAEPSVPSFAAVVRESGSGRLLPVNNSRGTGT
jgi:hypothetical protein